MNSTAWSAGPTNYIVCSATTDRPSRCPLGHLIAPSAYPEASIRVGVGNLIIEMTAVWVLVLAATGIYLWWPGR